MNEPGIDGGADAFSHRSLPGPPFRRFADFYPHYLSEHRCARCRLMHVIGTVLFVISLGAAAYFAVLLHMPLTAACIAMGVLIGYGFAWFGHLVFERNMPATFRNPLYSVAADFRMTAEILSGRRSLAGGARENEPEDHERA